MCVQVLEVATREGNVSNNLDLAVTGLRDDDLVTEVADTALDLDAVVEELLEGRDVEDLVARGLRSVDDELCFISILNCDFMRVSKMGAYLLGDLLGLATTSLCTGKSELAYCSIMSDPRISSGGTAKRFMNLEDIQ